MLTEIVFEWSARGTKLFRFFEKEHENTVKSYLQKFRVESMVVYKIVFMQRVLKALSFHTFYWWEVLWPVEYVAAMRVSDAAETVTTSGSLNLKCTDNHSMGLTIRSSYKQEISSVYQFIDVLYNLRSWVAL